MSQGMGVNVWNEKRRGVDDISEKQVLSALKKMKPGKFVVMDGNGVDFPGKGGGLTVKWLSGLFNVWINSGQVLED